MIHWLIQSLDDCPECVNCVAAPAWLGAAEQEHFSTLKVEKRRRDWLLGRWTAKNLVQQYLAAQGETMALDAIVIQADPDGAPFARGEGRGARGDVVERLPFSLSISHSHGTAFCGLAAVASPLTGLPPQVWEGRGGVSRPSLGCDIELVEAREANFVASFFTAEEMAAVAAAGESRDLLVTAIWSGKEAVLKAMREGLRIDTRRLSCRFDGLPGAAQAWSPMAVTVDDGLAAQFTGTWSGWWQVCGHFVLTMALLEEPGSSSALS